MKWADAISILSLALGSVLFLYAGIDTTNINGRSPLPSSVILVGDDGRTVPLDSLIGAGEVGLITAGEQESTSPGMPDAPPPSAAKATPAPCVNINTAGENQLITLKGIGPALAANIVAYRQSVGLFKRKEDIQKVKGIGPAKFAQIVDHICL
jgi:competence ComEA-like helix-hairpin-helix protein